MLHIDASRFGGQLRVRPGYLFHKGYAGVKLGCGEFVADGIFELKNYVSQHMELKTRFIVRKRRGTDHSRSIMAFHSLRLASRYLSTVHNADLML